MTAARLAIEPIPAIDATVVVPGSKSITNRALVCGALAPGTSRLVGALDADDVRAMTGALETLGVPVAWTDPTTLEVGGAPPSRPDVVLDARLSGTTSRFLLPMLGVLPGARRLDGDEPLRARPMGPSFEVLRSLGATVVEHGAPGHLPVTVTGPISSGLARVRGDTSSQFLSGLVLSAPSVVGGLRVEVTTELVSRPYVDLTTAVMSAFGVEVETPDASTWIVPEAAYAPIVYPVEPDASAASYFFAAAVMTGGRVTVPGLHRGSLQGDVGFVDVLEQMGATVRWEDDAITVAAGPALRGVDVDMAHISDTAQTLAAVAAVAEGPTRIRGVGFIRGKETDRLAHPVAELRRCGVEARETDDGMIIEPAGTDIGHAVIETYRDHRMAMAFGLLGLVRPGIVIDDPGCVDKTFPRYWEVLDELRAGAVPPARTA